MSTLKKFPHFPPEQGSILSSMEPLVAYEIVERIGNGAKGIAYKAIVRGGTHDGGTRVIKMLNLDFVNYSVDDIRRRIQQGHDAIQEEMGAICDMEDTEGIAPIVDIAGQAWGYNKDGNTELINLFHTVYDYVPGDDLNDWCEKNYLNDKGKFSGIKKASHWFKLSRKLFKTLDRIHHQRVVHGDLWPPNIRIRPDGAPIIIDFGQAWSLEKTFERQADNSKSHPYLAPERYSSNQQISRWYATADIYSMGGVLFYIATGTPPPSPWKNRPGEKIKSNREIKKEIAQKIRSYNPDLYKSNLGVIDVITMCLCPNLDYRARHASVVLETIDAFDNIPQTAEKVNDNDGIELINKELRQISRDLMKMQQESYSANPIFQKIVLRRIRSLRDDIAPLKSRVFSITGDREAHVNGLLDCVSIMREGDELTAVTSTRFWKKGNFGPYGRFSAMLSMAALRGAKIKWLILVNNQFTDEDSEILEYQKRIVNEFKECTLNDESKTLIEDKLQIHYFSLPEIELDLIRRARDTFVLVRTGTAWTLIAADYSDALGTISIIRLWAEPKRREVLLALYDKYLENASPVVLYNEK